MARTAAKNPSPTKPHSRSRHDPDPPPTLRVLGLAETLGHLAESVGHMEAELDRWRKGGHAFDWTARAEELDGKLQEARADLEALKLRVPVKRRDGSPVKGRYRHGRAA